MASLGVTSVNVNGIRAAARKGGVAWIGERLRSGASTVVCLQEVRATTAQFVEVLEEHGLTDLHWAHDDSTRLGHSGTALLSAVPMRDVKLGLDKRFDGTGRWAEATIDTAAGPLTVASVYVFAGDIEKPVQEEKYAFLAAMSKWFKAAQKSAAAGEGYFVVSGDYNVAHTEADIKNWKGNIGKAGFHVDERAYFDEWFGPKIGVVDLGRKHAGEVDGPYTWWSQRGQAFDTNTGWRIDYHVSDSVLAQKLSDVRIDKAASYAERWSDHAPLTAVFDF